VRLVLPTPEARPLSFLFIVGKKREFNLGRLAGRPVYEMQIQNGPVCKEQVQEAQQQYMTPYLFQRRKCLPEHGPVLPLKVTTLIQNLQIFMSE